VVTFWVSKRLVGTRTQARPLVAGAVAFRLLSLSASTLLVVSCWLGCLLGAFCGLIVNIGCLEKL